MAKTDSVLAKAVDLARETAVEVAGDAAAVGAHVTAVDEGERLVTHLFQCELPGYRGWVWSVTLSRAPRGKDAAVCEAHMVPADDALLAPPWVPWAERVRPGDLEPSMVLPKITEDPRLVPGFEATGDEDLDELAIWELGLGRERVLGPDGKDQAAERWYRGSHGPTAASAIAASAPCSTCAFFWPLQGSMRTVFGACTNEWSPSDGTVVSVDHGCGAHSQTDVEQQLSQWPTEDSVIDTDAATSLDLSARDSSDDAGPQSDAGDSSGPDGASQDGTEVDEPRSRESAEPAAD